MRRATEDQCVSKLDREVFRPSHSRSQCSTSTGERLDCTIRLSLLAAALTSCAPCASSRPRASAQARPSQRAGSRVPSRSRPRGSAALRASPGSAAHAPPSRSSQFPREGAHAHVGLLRPRLLALLPREPERTGEDGARTPRSCALALAVSRSCRCLVGLARLLEADLRSLALLRAQGLRSSRSCCTRDLRGRQAGSRASARRCLVRG